MEITASEIASVAVLRGITVSRIIGNAEAKITSILPFGDHKIVPCALYVAKEEDARLQSAKLRQQIVLVCKNAELSVQDIVAKTTTALVELYAWDSALNECVLEGKPLQELFNVGEQLLSLPVAFFDEKPDLIASSANYRSDINRKMKNEFDQRSTLDSLLMDDEYQDAPKHTTPFYYTGEEGLFSYCINVFDEGNYIGRVLFTLENNQTHLERGLESLAQRFACAVGQHVIQTKRQWVSSGESKLWSEYLTDVALGRTPWNSSFLSSLTYQGWSDTDKAQVVRFVFQKGAYWRSSPTYFCRALEEKVTSFAIEIAGEIVWFINLSHFARKEGTSFANARAKVDAIISKLCKDYACITGESCVLANACMIRTGYLEAGAALKIGGRDNPSFWRHSFSDYALPYMLEKAAEEIDAEELCHPALRLLHEKDNENGTQLAKTLVVYLRCGQSITKAAEELGIHRTSLQRRLKRIYEISGIDVDNLEDPTYLLLSALLLKW